MKNIKATQGVGIQQETLNSIDEVTKPVSLKVFDKLAETRQYLKMLEERVAEKLFPVCNNYIEENALDEAIPTYPPLFLDYHNCIEEMQRTIRRINRILNEVEL
jgi:hypothetical protein